MSSAAVWLLYRVHHTKPRTVEMLCVLSEPDDVNAVILHPLIREYSWERIGETNYHAYDENWEYKLERWEIDDSLVKTNWAVAGTSSVG